MRISGNTPKKSPGERAAKYVAKENGTPLNLNNSTNHPIPYDFRTFEVTFKHIIDLYVPSNKNSFKQSCMRRAQHNKVRAANKPRFGCNQYSDRSRLAVKAVNPESAKNFKHNTSKIAKPKEKNRYMRSYNPKINL